MKIKSRLIVGVIAIGAIVSVYQVFSSDRVSTATVINDQSQDSMAVQPQSRWDDSPPVSEPARTAEQTSPKRSGPPSKRF
jgi:hypothetical protein